MDWCFNFFKICCVCWRFCFLGILILFLYFGLECCFGWLRGLYFWVWWFCLDLLDWLSCCFIWFINCLVKVCVFLCSWLIVFFCWGIVLDGFWFLSEFWELCMVCFVCLSFGGNFILFLLRLFIKLLRCFCSVFWLFVMLDLFDFWFLFCCCWNVLFKRFFCLLIMLLRLFNVFFMVCLFGFIFGWEFGDIIFKFFSIFMSFVKRCFVFFIFLVCSIFLIVFIMLLILLFEIVGVLGLRGCGFLFWVRFFRYLLIVFCSVCMILLILFCGLFFVSVLLSCCFKWLICLVILVWLLFLICIVVF